MRILEGEQVLVRIYIGELDKWRHRPLSVALVERLRQEGFAGATVFRAVEGFGGRSVLHAAHVLRLSEDLPVLIEVVEAEEHLERLKGILDEMVDDGLVTLEKVQVLRYAPRSPPEPPPEKPGRARGRLGRALTRRRAR
jgi:PII-like signaling protein